MTTHSGSPCHAAAHRYVCFSTFFDRARRPPPPAAGGALLLLLLPFCYFCYFCYALDAAGWMGLLYETILECALQYDYAAVEAGSGVGVPNLAHAR